MNIITGQVVSQFKKGVTFSYSVKKGLKPVSFLGKIWRFICPWFANQQDLKIVRLLVEIFKQSDNHSDCLEISKLFYKKILRRKCFLSKKQKIEIKNFKNIWQTLLLSKDFNLPLNKLEQHLDFVEFVFKNYLYHRIDPFYRKNDLGIKYNQLNQAF